jgi:polynucleotide 5'-kinase involved in rRNA processing
MNYIFDGNSIPIEQSQNDVFNIVAKPIVDSAILGYSGTIIAYGPTNSGKTYTMRGKSGSEMGIMPRY